MITERVINGQTVHVFNLLGSWPVRLRMAFKTDIARSHSGRSTRVAKWTAPRWTFPLDEILTQTEAADLRQWLGTDANNGALVGLPLSMDQRTANEWIAGTVSTFDPQHLVRLSDATIHSKPFSGLTASATELYAPLLIGYLERPSATVAGMNARLTLTVEEDSDWSERVQVRGTASATFFEDTLPDARGLRDSSTDQIIRDQLGDGRRKHLHNETAPMRWEQEGTFILKDDAVREFLAFFQTQQGRVGSFSSAVWFTPDVTGTPEAPLASVFRFARDDLEMTFYDRDTAEVFTRLIQEPWEINPPDGEVFTDDRLFYLYRVDYAVPGAAFSAFLTSDEQDYAYSGNTYRSAPIEHDALEEREGFVNGSKLTLRIGKLNAAQDAHGLLGKIARGELEVTTMVTIYQVIQKSGGDVVEQLSKMPVRSVRYRGWPVEARLERRIKLEIPRLTLQRTDNRSIFSLGTDVDPTDYDRVVVVDSVADSGTLLYCTIDDAGANPAERYFDLGVLQYKQSKIDYQRRDIVRHRHSTGGSDMRLWLRKPLRGVQTGDTLTLLPGYSREWAQAQTLLTADADDTAGFMGFPYIPQRNPSTGPYSAEELSVGKGGK